MTRVVRWDAAAIDEIQAIPRAQARRIRAAIRRLAETGYGDVKKLAGDPAGIWRLRVGDWRVLFLRQPDAIVISHVKNRRDAYRD